MDKGLQRQGKNNRCPPANFLAAYAYTPRENQQSCQRRRDRGREACREIILAKDAVAHCLRPIGEGRLVQAKVVIEVGNDIVAALNHLA